MRSLSKSKWMEAVQSYVLYFFFYSVLGWLYEVFLEVAVSYTHLTLPTIA